MDGSLNTRLETTVTEVFEWTSDGVVVGRVALIVQQKPEGRPGGIIEDVWVADDFRRQGIATKLMEHAIASAWTWDCYKLTLACDPEGPAYPLYQKLGFRNHQQAMRLNHVPS